MIEESILASDRNDLEPRLTRYGHNAKALVELLNVRPKEIRDFLHSQLTPGRAQALQHPLLAAGILL